jgi:glutamine amidotransferase
MCELMGMSFAKPIVADFSIREFALRGEQNADGWGLAWYPDHSVAVVKEPLQWHVSAHGDFLGSYPHLRAQIYLAHVRHRTIGGTPTHADTHPFTREWGGRDYAFAHNGTVTAVFDRPLGRFHPVGGTDSEYLFCWLLNEIARHGHHLEQESDWRWLHEQLRMMNRGGKLNCLLSDGRRLFCYFDENGHKGLTYRHVHLYDESRTFGDPTVEIDVGDQLFNWGIVLASNPLSPTGWEHVQRGELLVLANGEIAFSTHGPAPPSPSGEEARGNCKEGQVPLENRPSQIVQ